MLTLATFLEKRGKLSANSCRSLRPAPRSVRPSRRLAPAEIGVPLAPAASALAASGDRTNQLFVC